MSVSVDLAQLAMETETHLAWTNTEVLAGCRVIIPTAAVVTLKAGTRV
jgi:hypothetical protein